MAEETKSAEIRVLLELYRQRYEHARMSEQLRATYFNIYIVVLGAGLAALADALSRASLTQIGPVGQIVGSVIWAMSLLSIMRSERFGGHISHDLKAVSRIRKQFAQMYPVVQVMLPDPKRKDTLGFCRLPWSRDKSVETMAGILGALAGSTLLAISLTDLEWMSLTLFLAGLLIGYGVLGLIELGNQRLSPSKRILLLVATLILCSFVVFFVKDPNLARVLIVSLGPLTGLAVWMAEISNLEDRHQ